MKKSYLKGNILCALPQLKDIFFSKSLIYITHHNNKGVVGIILNYKIMNVKSSDLFYKLKIKGNNNSNNIHFLFILVDHLIKIMVLFYIRLIIKTNQLLRSVKMYFYRYQLMY